MGDVGYGALRAFISGRPEQRYEDVFPVRRQIRSRLVSSLVEISGVASFLERLLSDVPIAAEILTAGSLAIVNIPRDKGVEGLAGGLLARYSHWLLADDFYIASNEDTEFTWSLAG